jgi:hypothetical protein
MTEAMPPRTGTLAVDEVTSYDVVQVGMHGALFPAFRAWIEARGLYLVPWPTEDDELPTFGIAIGDELWKRVRG